MKLTANRGFILLALLALSVSTQAQKLYKIVDAEGNVTFSQYPPQEKQEDSTIDEHTVSGGGQSVVTAKLDGLYCGDIQLSDERSSRQSTSSRVQDLEYKQSRWKKEQENLSQRIDTSNQNKINQNSYSSRYGSSTNKYYQEGVEKNSARMRDLRCALDWVDEELDAKSEVVVKNKKERARLEGIRNELQARLDRRCGQLPAYDPSQSYNSTARKNWYDCSNTLRKEIERVDRAIAGV